jgi:predicted ribosome quality control (RQC) complex YloA/Tae2 family protein
MKKLAPTKENIENLLSKGEDEKVVVALSRNINVPALYLNELLATAGIDPKKSAKLLDTAEKEKIIHSLSSLSDSIAEGKVSPVLSEDGRYFAIQLPGKEGRSFSSFSELLSEVHKQNKEGKKKEVQGAGAERSLKKLKHQEDRVEGLKKEIEAEGKLGAVVSENESVIHELTERLKALRKEGKNWEEIETELNKIHPVKIEKGKIVIEF